MSGFLGVAARTGAGRVLEARLLPRDVAWFYLRALRLAAAEGDRVSVASAPRPRELKALLTVARGCDHVVEIGTGDGWTAAALALDDPLRHVTAYHPVAHPARDRYLTLAGPSVRARVDALTGSSPAAVVPPSGSACMLVIDGTRGRDEVMSAFSGCLASVRTGGLVVFRGYADPHHPGVGEAVLALGLEGRPGPGGTYVWRKPEPPRSQPPVAAAPPKASRPRRRPRAGRLLVPALVVAGLAAGAGLAALVTGGSGDDRPGTANASKTTESGRTASNATAGGKGGTAATALRRRRAAARARERSARARQRRRRGATGQPGAKQRRAGRRQRRTGAGGDAGGGSRGGGSPSPGLEAGFARHFSGSGRRRLGDIRVARDSVLAWSSDLADLSIRSAALRLNSARPRGHIQLSSGIYRDFTVESAGRWTITLRPR
jgi:hypothetical protein